MNIFNFTNFKRFLNFIKFEFSIYGLELVAFAVLSLLGAMHGNFFRGYPPLEYAPVLSSTRCRCAVIAC